MQHEAPLVVRRDQVATAELFLGLGGRTIGDGKDDVNLNVDVDVDGDQSSGL